jgi:hypothetical protein
MSAMQEEMYVRAMVRSTRLQAGLGYPGPAYSDTRRCLRRRFTQTIHTIHDGRMVFGEPVS